MLISPPFLFERGNDEAESKWLEKCFPLHSNLEGMYPVSHALAWHGGLHLQKPNTPLRAIADGTVVYKREPSPKTAGSTMKDSPLNYHSSMGVQKWTHDGVLVIRHSTDIGSGANACDIEFYSIYLHLSKISADVKQGEPVYRKSEIGTPGLEEAQQGIVHFEIVCDQANLKKLVGREQDLLPLDKHGRTDAVYGSLYFIIAANSKIFEDEPKPNQLNPVQGPDIRVTETFIVSLRFDQGHAYLQCRTLSGELMGKEKKIENAEYDLYTKASKTSTSYIRDKGEAHIPAPSAVYEQLRFGRIINTEHEQLPANYDVPNWWPIDYQGKTRWVDLNEPKVKKFSDADFPHWMGWRLIDDCQDQDSRCDSPMIKKMLEVDGKLGVSPAEAKEKLGKPDVREQLSKLICKFPSEWVRSSFDKRFSWIKKASVENPFPLNDQDYADIKLFFEKLAFWEDMNQAIQAQGGKPLPDMVWHFHPKAFVQHFRMCGWLSKGDLARIYPNEKFPLKALEKEGRGRTPDSIREQYRLPINICMRKYFITTPIRMAHFFGQGAVESTHLALMIEGEASFNKNPSHPSLAPETNGFYLPLHGEGYYSYLVNRLGNIESGDAAKFRGRGMKQLTGRENYAKYWVYRGWLKTSSFKSKWWGPAKPADAPQISDPQKLSTIPFYAIDAGCWYWEAGAAKAKFHSINRVIKSSKIDRESVFSVSEAINGLNSSGEPNGLSERIKETLFSGKILMDNL